MKSTRVVYEVTDDKVNAEKTHSHLQIEGRNPHLSLHSEMENPPGLQGKYVVWYVEGEEGCPNTNTPQPNAWPENVRL